jgi:cytochrome c-type biogenesis protein CcmH
MRGLKGFRGWVMAVLVALVPVSALAVQPDEILPDAALEHRARVISVGLRCLVCQNQSIDDSDAPLAKDLRVLVRERLKAGDSDQAVMAYIVARYGDFVLLKPPLKPETLLLWLTPLIVVLAGLWYSWRALNAREAVADGAVPLTEAERKKLSKILGQTSDKA